MTPTKWNVSWKGVAELAWTYLHKACKEGHDPIVSEEKHGFEIGKAIELKQKNASVALLSTGVMASVALETAEKLKQQGINASVIRITQLNLWTKAV